MASCAGASHLEWLTARPHGKTPHPPRRTYVQAMSWVSFIELPGLTDVWTQCQTQLTGRWNIIFLKWLCSVRRTYLLPEWFSGGGCGSVWHCVARNGPRRDGAWALAMVKAEQAPSKHPSIKEKKNGAQRSPRCASRFSSTPPSRPKPNKTSLTFKLFQNKKKKNQNRTKVNMVRTWESRYFDRISAGSVEGQKKTQFIFGFANVYRCNTNLFLPVMFKQPQSYKVVRNDFVKDD